MKLSYMYGMIGAFLKANGDKEVISIGSYNGSSEVDYEINLADIYNGPLGSNPFTGRCSIRLLKESAQKMPKEVQEAVRTLEAAGAMVAGNVLVLPEKVCENGN